MTPSWTSKISVARCRQPVGEFSPMETHRPEWIAACHEAGHAVAAYILGAPTGTVSIHGDRPGEGHWTSAERFDKEGMRDTWSNYTVVGEMGKRVEIMLFGRYENRF